MNEEQKQQRRTLIENNRAWASAETVRRASLTEFLSRKTLPQDVDRVTAFGLTTHRDDVQKAMQGGNRLAHELLGISTDGGWAFDNLSPIIESNPARSATSRSQ